MLQYMCKMQQSSLCLENFFLLNYGLLKALHRDKEVLYKVAFP